MKKTCLLIVGMHRTGTSFMAGLLRCAGLDLGSDLMVSSKWNEKGHFEHNQISKVNDEILHFLGSSWNDPTLITKNLVKATDNNLIIPIKKLLTQEFIGKDTFVIKDPRISVLLPIYFKVLGEMNVSVGLIIMRRKYIEIVESLRRRDGMGMVTAFKLCEKYYSLIEANSKDKNFINIDFDECLSNPFSAIEEIRSKFLLDLKLSKMCKYHISDFVDKRLKHHNLDNDRYLRVLAKEIDEKNSCLADQKKKISDQKKEISDQKKEISDQKKEISDQKKEISLWKKNSKNQEEHINFLKSKVEELENVLENKRSHIAIVAKHVEEIQRRGESFRKEKIWVETRLAAKEKSFDWLKEELRLIESSVSWQFIKKTREKLYSVSNKIPLLKPLYLIVVKVNRWLLTMVSFLLDGNRLTLSNGEHKTKKIYKKRLPAVKKVKGIARRIRGFSGTFPVVKEPKVSIVMLTNNKVEYTLEALRSIIKNTSVSYELIIVDNASNDKTHLLLAKLKNVKIILNKTNLRFAAGCNLGVEQALGEYVLFINNDTLVSKNWLNSLVNVMENDSLCAAVGSKLVYPDGRLQEAGSIIWRDGSAKGYGRHDHPSNPKYCFLRQVDYCSAASLLVRKKVFDEIGGFDKRFYPAYYEDTDLCMNIWQKGYRVYYQPLSVVYHYEFVTNQDKVARYQKMTQSIFFNKWKKILENNFFAKESNIIFARNKAHGRNFLVIDDRVPTPDQGRGYPRAYSIVKSVSDLGFNVTFFPLVDKTEWQPYTENLQQLGVEVYFGEYANLESFMAQREDVFDIVLISRPHNMSQAFRLVKRFQRRAQIIYDAEALFSIRQMLKSKVNNSFQVEKFDQDIKEEIKMMSESDVVMIVSDHEKKQIIKRNPELNERICIVGHSLEPIGGGADYEDRKDILFVGGEIVPGSPNEDAIYHFATKIFPQLNQKLGCRLIVVGKCSSARVKQLISKNIDILGYVKDIKPYYEKCRLFVVPHRFSAGISWKTQEAMAYGLPVVISQLTADQLGITNKQCAIASCDRDFIAKTELVYNDSKLWVSLKNLARDYVLRECSRDNFQSQLQAVLNKVTQLKPQQTRFIIIGRARVGGSFLVSRFHEHSKILAYSEPFPHEKLDTASLQREWMNKFFTDNFDKTISCCGFRTKVDQIADKESFASLVADLGVKIIFLDRKNAVKEAISRWNGDKLSWNTGNYNLVKEADRLNKSPINVNNLKRDLDRIKKVRQESKAFFDSLNARKMTICYEDLLKNTERSFRKLYRFLDMSYEYTEPVYIKSNSDDLREVLTNFSELRDVFSGSEYEGMLCEVIKK